MTNNNNLKLIENKKPVETVYEIKKSSLSPVARGKVVKKYGSDYVSERVGGVNFGYGPMPNYSYGYGCNPDRFKSEFTVSFSLVSGFKFKQGEVCFSSCEISGRGDGNVRSWKQKVENGEIKIVNSSNERDYKCIEKENI